MDIGFIGAGTIAEIHLENLRTMDHADVVAVCDADSGTAEAVAADHDATAYTDDERMLADEPLDAVILGIPPFAHDGQERRVLDAGADLFVEKPVALDPSYARDIASAVADAGAVVHVGYVFRYTAVVEFLRGRLPPDDVSHVVGRYTVPEPPDRPWWSDRAQSGGQILEQTTHIFDTLRYLFGDVEWVAGIGSRRHRESLTFNDTTAVALRHESGVVDTVVSSSAADETDVSLHLSGPVVELDVDLLGGEIVGSLDGTRIEQMPGDEPFRTELAAFLDAVEAHDPDAIRCPYDEGLATLELTLDVVDAVDRGDTIVR